MNVIQKSKSVFKHHSKNQVYKLNQSFLKVMRKALDFKALLLLILVVFSNGRFYSPEFQDVDTFQSKAQMNRQVTTGILINLQYINKYISN